MTPFAEILKALRGSLTQDQFAKLADLTQPQISRFEKGKPASLETRMKVYERFKSKLWRLGYRREDVLGRKAA
jgi:transcriptional regulator with XRE-family HTH domain